MQHDRRVHPALAGLVHRMSGYDLRLDPRAVHHGVPGPSATVIISFDEPLDVTWCDKPDARSRQWLLASGLHTRPALIRTHGVQHGIQLDLTPAGCRALLGVPAAAIARGLVAHADLPTGIPHDLHERLAGLNRWGWDARFALLEEHLLQVVSRERSVVPDDLAHAWRLLDRRGGRVTVSGLASEVGWSRRHLVTRFTGEFGLPPQEVRQLHRFGAAMRLARAGQPWVEVAARAGYADQAHLSREFRALAGQTPTQWRSEVFPIVQDDPA